MGGAFDFAAGGENSGNRGSERRKLFAGCISVDERAGREGPGAAIDPPTVAEADSGEELRVGSGGRAGRERAEGG